MARGRVLTRPGKKIDYKQWSATPSIRLGVTTDTTVVGGSIGFTFPATILRARGSIVATLEAPIAAGDMAKFTFGLGIISTDSFTAGTSVPDPAGEPDYPWLWWTEFALTTEVATINDSFGLHSHRVEVDTKAMRRVKPGQSLAWILQRADIAGDPPATVHIAQTRVLIGT